MSEQTVDRIKVNCTKCKNTFRERVRNLRSGYQVQCPHCYRMITFDESSDDTGVRRALTQARRIRTGFVAETPETSTRSG
jgi:NAD-dependent SIR2 family protein deacetylase